MLTPAQIETGAYLTWRDRDLLVVLASMEDAPTVRELQDALGWSTTSVVAHSLRALRGWGLVTWRPFKSRTLRLTDAGQDAAELLAGIDARMEGHRAE